MRTYITNNTNKPTHLRSPCHFDDGSSIAIIDRKIAELLNANLRRIPDVRVHGINSERTYRYATTLQLTFVGEIICHHDNEELIGQQGSIRVAMPFIVGDLSPIPILISRPQMRWMGTITSTKQASLSTTIMGRNNWPYRIAVNNVSWRSAVDLASSTYTYGPQLQPTLPSTGSTINVTANAVTLITDISEIVPNHDQLTQDSIFDYEDNDIIIKTYY
jgi:hypothetical protein